MRESTHHLPYLAFLTLPSPLNASVCLFVPGSIVDQSSQANLSANLLDTLKVGLSSALASPTNPVGCKLKGEPGEDVQLTTNESMSTIATAIGEASWALS